MSVTTRLSSEPIRLTLSRYGLQESGLREALKVSLERGVRAWNQVGHSCGAPELVLAGESSYWRAEPDGRNLVVLRSEEWCLNGSCGSTKTYPNQALAMTSTWPEASLGRLVQEADIELQTAALKRLLVGHVGGGLHGQQALDAIVVHELGHVLGLEDLCSAHVLSTARVSGSTICPTDAAERAMLIASRRAAPSQGDAAALCELWRADSTASAAVGSKSSALTITLLVAAMGLLAAVMLARRRWQRR